MQRRYPPTTTPSAFVSNLTARIGFHWVCYNVPLRPHCPPRPAPDAPFIRSYFSVLSRSPYNPFTFSLFFRGTRLRSARTFRQSRFDLSPPLLRTILFLVLDSDTWRFYFKLSINQTANRRVRSGTVSISTTSSSTSTSSSASQQQQGASGASAHSSSTSGSGTGSASGAAASGSSGSQAQAQAQDPLVATASDKGKENKAKGKSSPTGSSATTVAVATADPKEKDKEQRDARERISKSATVSPRNALRPELFGPSSSSSSSASAATSTSTSTQAHPNTGIAVPFSSNYTSEADTNSH